jgi:phage tail sheath protein FI
MRPGVDVLSRAQPLPQTVPTDVSAAFVVGKPATVPAITVQKIRSLTEYEAIFGVRTGATDLYDAVDAFFREGGAALTVSAMAAAGAPAIVTALGKLTEDLGPGQVFVADPLANVIATQTGLLDHAAANNRVALLQAADGTAASLISAQALVKVSANARYGAFFAPSIIIPGITPGTTRTVGATCVVAGLIARNDSVYGPNTPAAGVNGQAVFATDVLTRYTDAEYSQLNDACVDMTRVMYNGVRLYGYRSTIDPTTAAASWLNFSNSRLNMAIVAQANLIGENFMFSQLDGRRKTISQFGGSLRAMLVPFFEAGSLYGETAEDAFQVNVGTAVNTAATIANGELHAVLQVRMSPFAEWVVIEIVKVATTQALAA